MAEVTINRDAGDKSKGFRLQKLRAIDLLLDSIQQSECAQIFAVIEHEEDIYLEKNTEDKTEEYLEENKNYDPVRTFTFASAEVKNTLVSFLDCWINRDMSNDVFFGFYTNINIGKENQTSRLTKIGITMPAKPILELLINLNYSEPYLLDTVKFIILEEYKKQYVNENIKVKGHYNVIKAFSDETWKDFLSKIAWKFGQEDEEQLKTTLIQKIRKSKYFDISLAGKENHIIALAEQKFDERQKYREITKKVVHASELKLIFMEVKSGEYKLNDPSYKMWELLPPVTDKRNLESKIYSVCPRYSKRKIGNLSRKVVHSRIEQDNVLNKKELLAYKYQIFDICKDRIDSFLDVNPRSNLKDDVVDGFISELSELAKKHIEDKSKDYKYTLKSEVMILNIILELFDSCYLAFDEEESV